VPWRGVSPSASLYTVRSRALDIEASWGIASANPAGYLSPCCLRSGPTSCTFGIAMPAQARAPFSASSTDSCDRLTTRFQWPAAERAAPRLVTVRPHPRPEVGLEVPVAEVAYHLTLGAQPPQSFL